MNEHIKLIAERLKGLRESLDLSYEEMAIRCEKSVDEIKLYESGTVDISMGYLFEVSHHLGIEMSVLISGTEPRMKSYFLTRYGKGVSVERTKAYKYQALASGFQNPLAEPFEVTVEPNNEDVFLNKHEGHEFNYVLEGRMLMRLNDKELILSKGDSIYFDSSNFHGIKALDDKPVKLLAIIL